MSWPFRRFTSNTGLDPEGHRLLGTTLKGEPIWAPKGHSLLLSANGGGKTTAGAMPWLYSLLSSDNRPATLVFDSKDGELCSQAAPMIAEMGIPVAAIDEMGVLGLDYPYRVTVNALGGVVSTYQRNPQDLVFTSENANQALISDPPDDQKNQYFRDQPRTLLEYIIYALLKRKQRLATLGAVWGLISNPIMLLKIAKIDAVEGDDLLKALAMDVLDMSTHEHWPAHRSAALKALRIFSAGSRMFEAGLDPDATHADLIRKRAVIFLVGPQAFMNRLGAIYALHILAFTEALYKGAGPLTMIGDEFTNAPLKPLVEALTTLRAYGGEIHLIAQSRSEIERRFGRLETQTIEENAIVKQWFGFSSFEEAERVSKALGEGQYVSSNLSTDNKDIRLQSTYQTGKERLRSAAQLMEMKHDEQLVHIKGLGSFLAKKPSMEMIAPYCHLIRPNPLEGGILPPNPKIILRTPKGDHS